MTDQPASEAEGAAETATCYRHPNREAHIRCVRCERRICPDCMIDASVGFQCPECVAAGNKGVREARTIFGGRVARDPGYISKALIAVNVLAYLLQRVPDLQVTERFVLVGVGIYSIGPVGVADGEYYRLLTAAFLHGGMFHLLLNMYALFLFGPALERAFGRTRFTILYLISALGGTAASYAFSNPIDSSLGASGAVFGLMGALLVVGRRLGTDPRAVLLLLSINLLAGFFIPRIDWRAHLGGLIVGTLCALALAGTPRQPIRAVQIAGAVGLALLITALVLWRTAQLTA